MATRTETCGLNFCIEAILGKKLSPQSSSPSSSSSFDSSVPLLSSTSSCSTPECFQTPCQPVSLRNLISACSASHQTLTKSSSPVGNQQPQYRPTIDSFGEHLNPSNHQYSPHFLNRLIQRNNHLVNNPFSLPPFNELLRSTRQSSKPSNSPRSSIVFNRPPINQPFRSASGYPFSPRQPFPYDFCHKFTVNQNHVNSSSLSLQQLHREIDSCCSRTQSSSEELKSSLKPTSERGISKKKRSGTRAVFSSHVRKNLESVFLRQQYIDRSDRKKLAEALQLGEPQVKVWFQNRRCKLRRETKKATDSTERKLSNPNDDVMITDDSRGNNSGSLEIDLS